MRGLKRAGQRALMGCSGAGGAWNRGCGATEVADDGVQDCGGAVTMVIERRRTRGSEMRPREEVKEVGGNSWMLCGTKKGHGRAGAAAGDRRCDVAAAGDGGATWQGGEKPAGLGKRRPGALEGQVVGLKWRGAAGSTGARWRRVAGRAG
jgi:hypothetical protein